MNLFKIKIDKQGNRVYYFIPMANKKRNKLYNPEPLNEALARLKKSPEAITAERKAPLHSRSLRRILDGNHDPILSHLLGACELLGVSVHEIFDDKAA